MPFFVLLLEDYLCQHRTRDVLAGLCIIDNEILAVLDHGGEVLKRHVGAGAGIVEPPVRVLFDCNRLFFFLCHVDHTFPLPMV